MAKYKYLVTDKNGIEQKGVIEAADEKLAVNKLKADGSLVMEIREHKSLSDASWNITIGNPVRKKDITIFCKQFYSILNAGVTVIDGLRMVIDQTENKELKKALTNVRVNVEKGDSLADAMAAEGKVFPDILIHMVAAGEATGNLEIAFDRICRQFDKDLKLTSMVRSAMIYPVVVLIVAVGVVILLMVTVIPNFQSAFTEMGEELPFATRMVIAVSDFMVGNIVLVVSILIGLVVAIMVGKSTEPGKRFTSHLALILPMIKTFAVKNAAAKFSMTMSTLIASGVPIVEAIGIAADVIENRVIRDSLFSCKESVMEGVPMSEPIAQAGIFPPMLHHMLKIGEDTGTTEQMLDKVAEYYEGEVEEATKNLTTAMEPLIIIVLAVLVGGVVGAIVMPMLGIYQHAGNA